MRSCVEHGHDPISWERISRGCLISSTLSTGQEELNVAPDARSTNVRSVTELPYTPPLYVLVIQMGTFTRLVETAKAVYEAYPSASCVGWVRSEDLKQARA